MPWSDDVLRGLRWGAILVAGLAIGVACYRVLHEAPPKPALETSSAVVPATLQESSDDLPTAKSIDKPSAKPALSTLASRPVPSPPARAAKPVASNPPRSGSVEASPAGEPASRNEDDPVTIEKPAGSLVEPVDEKDTDHSAAGKDPAESPSPATLSESAPRQDARGKRWIKAVGRLFGIGRKDQPH